MKTSKKLLLAGMVLLSATANADIACPQGQVWDGDYCVPVQTGTIPEPTSMALLAIGAVGVAVSRRKYK